MSAVRSRSPNGFALLEVLVALLIVGVGMLGIAALVLFSMRASFESGLQTYAALLAVDAHETAWLAAHTIDQGDNPDCEEIGDDIGSLINLDRFLPDMTIPGLNADISGIYPECILEVSWGEDGHEEEAGDSAFGVVGQMARFGGESGGTFIHRFIIPAVD